MLAPCCISATLATCPSAFAGFHKPYNPAGGDHGPGNWSAMVPISRTCIGKAEDRFVAFTDGAEEPKPDR